MYAAHDPNIACILSALDNFDNEIPYYGNSLMFELHEDDNEYYVQVKKVLFIKNILIRDIIFKIEKL